MSRPTRPGASYRYRTRALVGPWQPTRGAALDDAIRAGQAKVDAGGNVHWIIRGEIEESFADR